MLMRRSESNYQESVLSHHLHQRMEPRSLGVVAMSSPAEPTNPTGTVSFFTAFNLETTLRPSWRSQRTHELMFHAHFPTILLSLLASDLGHGGLLKVD